MAKPVLWYIDLKAECVIEEFFKDPDFLEMWDRRPTASTGPEDAHGVVATVGPQKHSFLP